jgi:arsenate reductase
MSAPDDTTIYYNPRCSKCRATLELLHERGIGTQVIEYLDTPPDDAELRRILKLLGLKPRELLRQGETVYRELHLDNPALGDDEIIAAMVAHPILIERPIVIANGKATIGRPPERVLDIL